MNKGGLGERVEVSVEAIRLSVLEETWVFSLELLGSWHPEVTAGTEMDDSLGFWEKALGP